MFFSKPGCTVRVVESVCKHGMLSYSSSHRPLRCQLLSHSAFVTGVPLHAQVRQNRAGCKTSRGPLQVCAALSVASSNPWRVWACLTCAGAAGLWSEKTKWGKELSGPLVSTLAGLLLSNLGLISANAPEYTIVNKYLLTLAVPLLLLSADLRRVIKDTGRLLVAFLIGSVATVAGTLVAFKALPLADMGADGWKVASALAARHIGGAVNYVGVAETLAISPSAQAAGLAADSLICAFYFAGLFKLASRIGPDATPLSQTAAAPEAVTDAQPQEATNGIQVLEGATAVGLACLICQMGSRGAQALGLPGAVIPVVTGITVTLATCVPGLLKPLVPSAEGIAAILMQIFFAAVGAAGSIRTVIQTAPSLFLFSSIQIGIHLAIILAAGKLLGFSRKDVLLASNANVGGPTTAAGMAAAKGWKSSIVPSLLVGTLGYAIATFLAVALGTTVLQHW